MNLKFKDCPVGAKYKYPDGSVWVVIENYGRGLVASWNGYSSDRRTQFCCFVDEDHTLDSEVEIVDRGVLTLAVKPDTKKFKDLLEQLQREAFEAGFHARDRGMFDDMTYQDNVNHSYVEWRDSK